jgi:hypothetical protein
LLAFWAGDHASPSPGAGEAVPPSAAQHGRVPSPRARIPDWLTHADAGTLLYGAIVSGATLGAVSAHADESTRVAAAAVFVTAVYWAAHLYVHTLTQHLEGSDRRRLLHRLATSARAEAGVLVGGLPIVAVYLTLVVFGASPNAAGFGALTFLIVLLFGVGHLGATQAGLTGWTALGEATLAGFFGVLIVMMKGLLH